MSTHAHSTPAEVLFIEGADAGSFLHGQLSSDVTSLKTMHWQFSAWLDAQGRVKYLLHLARLADERWMILLRGGQAKALMDDLRRYVFRAKLSMHPGPASHLCSAPAAAMHAVTCDDDRIVLGCGNHALRVSGSSSDGDDVWRREQIDAGWPWLPEGTRNELLPPSLSLHHLGAISLGKGCYPGQELVARLHYRGGNKRHLHTVLLSHPTAPGTRLEYAADARGIQLLDAVTTQHETVALAVLSDVLVAQMQGDSMMHFGDDMTAQISASWPA